MPGPLLDSAPFRQRRHEELESLVTTLDAALDPDAVELAFRFLPDGRHYRRRFTQRRRTDARAVREVRREEPPRDAVLEAPFRADGLVDGALRLLRRRARPWTGAERSRFALLSPLVSQLLACAARLERDGRARLHLLSAAERADAPILLLDASGTILFANQAADALLSQQTENGLAVLADDRRSTPLLSHLMRIASLDPPVARERLALTDGRYLEARVSLAETGADAREAVRVVTLHERAPLALDDVRPLLSSRGVSEREVEVVGCVLRGLRNAEIAEALFISEYTVKDHLKHVFVKLGVAGRAGLIRELYSGPS